jgi:hypothetical protein
VITKHVLVGALFTSIGLISLLIPALPFICIGALIWGPVELFIGLTGKGGGSRVRQLSLPSAASVAPISLPSLPGSASPPTIRVATKKTYRKVYAVVSLDGSSPHEIVAGYEGTLATVLVDGTRYAQFHRYTNPLYGWGPKDVDIPFANDPPRQLTVRFFGARPHINILYGGQVVGGV